MAVFHSFSHSMLPPILSEFALRYPGVHVTARLVPRVDMERDLVNAELDFAVAYIADDNDQIVAERLFDEELVLVVGSKHSHAGRKSMPMRELAKLPLVLLTPEFGARQFVDRFFAGTGLQPHVVLEMNAIEPIMATIRDSGSPACCRPAPSSMPSGLHIVRLTEPAPKRKRRHPLAAQRPSLGGRVAHGRNDQGCLQRTRKRRAQVRKVARRWTARDAAAHACSIDMVYSSDN